METKTNSTKEKFFDQLKRVQQEMEELAVQFSLGKSEAKVKFESLKKDLSASLHHLKEKYEFDEKSNQLKKMLQELELQLSLGKAEAAEKFEEQKKKIQTAINKFAAEFKSRFED